MQRNKTIILTVLPALLFYLAWPPRYMYVLAFVAFIPLFELERQGRGKRGSYWLIYASLFLFNLVNTWWVWYASAPGSVAMLIANTFLMTIPFVAYRKASQVFGQGKGLMAFIPYWMAIEYLHLNWDISWPWLSLGNIFSLHPYAIQWYEYTGMMGGSLWILLINVLLYYWWLNRKRFVLYLSGALFLIPFAISYVIGSGISTFDSDRETYQVLIVQPNVDPYEKFNAGVEVRNFLRMLEQVEERIDAETDYVVLPETAIVENIDEDYPGHTRSVRLIQEFLERHPHVQFISGASTYHFFGPDEKLSATARSLDDGRKYDFYNSSMVMDVDKEPRFYHKSKLVPGVEQMPYPELFGFLEYWSLDMGGISGSLGKDKEPKVFTKEGQLSTAPLVCYESIFPGFAARFVREGADLILVMTNDGWWKDTDGYKQHMHYARLRAVETRRDVVRSANTGISCHINKKGDILAKADWWTEDVLKVEVQAGNGQTFFVQQGNYIGRFAAFFAIFLWLGAFVKRRVKHAA